MTTHGTDNVHSDGTPESDRRSYPSIFNDVIGPVMRGPSSSHCAASVRIGRMARDLMGGRIDRVHIQFDPNGSLATTHASQGSDMGLFGGLLGWDATDERLVQSTGAIREAGIEIEIEVVAYGATHPNTYKMTLDGASGRHQMIAISTGGGMIEIVEIDGVAVSMAGDCYETLVFLGGDADPVLDYLAEQVVADEVMLLGDAGRQIIEIRGLGFPDKEVVDALVSRYGVREVAALEPVLPVLSRPDAEVPFITGEEMLAYAEARDLSLSEAAIHYECARGGLSDKRVLLMMQDIIEVMQASIGEGLEGTMYADRILGRQSGAFGEEMVSGRLLDAGMLNWMILYVTALMETKSAMGVIVAAPTAGACGGLPGAVVAAADAMGLEARDMARAMLAGGMIGVLIAAHSTFAAEVCGCQAECGAGSGMAAAALVTLVGGTARQAVAASSMALQNILGMICDPVANRVEVPCLGRNVLAASNALACANMALAGFDPVIPLDQVIETMDRVGKSLPSELRCTALGGLSITPRSKEIERRLRPSIS